MRTILYTFFFFFNEGANIFNLSFGGVFFAVVVFEFHTILFSKTKSVT